MLSRCFGGLRQAWPCGGSSGVVGFADCAVSDGLGLARWNSLRACSAPLKQPPRVSLRSAPKARPAPGRQTQPPRKIAPTEPGLPQPPSMVARNGGVPTVLLPRRVRPGAGAPYEVPRSADAVAARFSALRHLACGGCLSGALQARSEFSRVATASSIAGEPVRSTGHLVEAPAPGRTRLEPPTPCGNTRPRHQHPSEST